ncbi:hypothetical protein C8Q80DRAFT_1098417 [Daedaleopsis nitida]|nr:hypothetical protein C8Q80DRAFT_1098417 [Daedaleopsis nitida]
MVDWSSQREIAKEGVSYSNLIFACFGLYIWEVFQTFDFELSILQRRRKLRWQWVPFFFLCRYCLIFSLAALMASFTVKTQINCQALYTFICWAGNMSIICSSTTLMLRTVAIWNNKRPVAIPLGIMCLAHWALLYRGMFIITAEYDATKLACVVATTNHLFLSLTYWATMAFNLVILGFHVVGLMRRDRVASLWQLLFQDGVILYLIAFSCNALPAVSKNPRMDGFGTSNSIIVLDPQLDQSERAVAACRTVTHLRDLEDDDDDDVYVHSSKQLAAPRLPTTTALRLNSRYPTRPEVHVTTDHIVMED